LLSCERFDEKDWTCVLKNTYYPTDPDSLAQDLGTYTFILKNMTEKEVRLYEQQRTDKKEGVWGHYETICYCVEL
jgi:hypothetical protein